jgi:chromosome segregation ATPase
VVQDKTSAESAKGNLERELKREKSKAGTLSDKLGKREEVEERKRGALATELERATADVAGVREELKAALAARAAAAEAASTAEAALVEARAVGERLQADMSDLRDELEKVKGALKDAEQREAALKSEVSPLPPPIKMLFRVRTQNYLKHINSLSHTHTHTHTHKRSTLSYLNAHTNVSISMSFFSLTCT